MALLHTQDRLKTGYWNGLNDGLMQGLHSPGGKSNLPSHLCIRTAKRVCDELLTVYSVANTHVAQISSYHIWLPVIALQSACALEGG